MTAEYIDHPMITQDSIEARIYQQILFATAVKDNTLVVLPTGLGKTIVFIMVMAHYLHEETQKKVIVTAPTRPLVDQHYQSCLDFLKIDESEIMIMSGNTSPEERIELWQKGRVFITTPQTLRNDIISNSCKLDTIQLICFDEAHRAVGDDPYVLVAEQFKQNNPGGRILGFTASPGSNKEKIWEIIKNLFIETIEFMDEDHPHVKPYTFNTSEQWIWVDLTDEMEEILSFLKDYTKNHLQILKDLELTNSIQISRNPKRKLIKIPKILNSRREEISDDEFYKGMISYGQVMLSTQAIEMFETQGLKTLHSYIEDKKSEYKKNNKNSLRRFLEAPQIKKTYKLLETMMSNNIEHPKLSKLRELVKETTENMDDSRILVFSNYKATAQFLTNQLNLIDDVSAHRFVGQSSSNYGKGLSQKEQKEVMDAFRDGTYNLLVSTSVGEEGLDVAQCDLVIFYDVTPSATRLIQRSGRTGRARTGRVVILITKGTRDEGYFYASKKQRSKLKSLIDNVKSELKSKKENQKQGTLNDFFHGNNDTSTSENKQVKSTEDQNQSDLKSDLAFDNSDDVKIFIDYREKGAKLLRHLMNADIDLKQVSLPTADFVLSDRVGIERKTVRDFTQTLIDGDLFDQLKTLKLAYQKPMLLIEGENLFQGGINPAAMRGALVSIKIDYNIPVIYTNTEQETVDFLVSIAKREQKNKTRKPQIRSSKPSGSLLDDQLYLLSSLPNVDRVLAERILDQFNNLREFFNANQDELRKVYGIGPQIADRIDILLSTPFSEEEA